MRSYLIYSQSDQNTLRDERLDTAFHGVSVPGTIAAYFRDATASFILTSDRPYFIDLRTPLFQGDLPEARPSHMELARVISQSVFDRLASTGRFDAGFYSDDVLTEVLDGVVEFQNGYAAEAPRLAQKLARYARLRAEARGEPIPADPVAGAREPEMILSPYFCCASSADDPWLDVMRRSWALVAQRPDSHAISPVLGLNSDDPGHLANLIGLVPPEMNRRLLFWLTGFDERSESVDRLVALWRVVATYSHEFALMNLYGSYFSVMAHKAGLAAVNSGIGYSEFRRWPELSSSGAAPARYYVPALHSFVSPGVAQLLIDRDPWFACECAICQARTAGGAPAVVSLSYHELKKHFVLARASEIASVVGRSVVELRREIDAVSARVEPFVSPGRDRIQGLGASHLRAWSEALGRIDADVT